MIPVLHSTIHSQTSSGELGDFWDSGRLRSLQSKVDTTISRVAMYCWLCPVLGCMVY